MKLTYKDIETILSIENNILHECNDNSQLVIEAYPKGEDYYGEILRRFNNQRIKSQRMISAEAKEAMYDNPAWSEEDKRKINRIYSVLRQAADTHAYSTSCRLIGDKECVELQDFLKSLKDRVQPKQEWSEEDENHLESIGWKLLDYTLSTAIPECKKEAKEDCFWLKSLKQRIGG